MKMRRFLVKLTVSGCVGEIVVEIKARDHKQAKILAVEHVRNRLFPVAQEAELQ